jgi:hypothetical protein
MRLARLDKSLRQWNADGNVHHAVIVGLRERMQHISSRFRRPACARERDSFLVR